MLRESRAAREVARDEDTGEPEHRTDWVAVGWVVGGFAAFAVLLPWL
ncbi:MAG: Tricarboxylate transport protein TctB, partial [Arsenicicoccus sp.]